MRLFKNLFGQKGEPAPDSLAQEFDAEWPRAVKRFEKTTGMGELKLSLRHPQTQEVMTPHEGLGATFNDWKQADAPYNKRRVLSHLLVEMIGGAMNAWQAANFFTSDSRPLEALAILEEEPPDPDSEDYAAHCVAYARTLLSMIRYPEALEWARKAAEAAPADPQMMMVLADAMHLNRQCEEAHNIYTHLMAKAPQSEAGGPDAVDEMFRNLFARDTGVVSSPVLALDLPQQLSNPVQAARFWELAETEFYYSPYFRMHHAYHLAQIGETEHSFAKLIGLVQEMDWVKEANLNLANHFTQFDPPGTNIMPEFQAELRQRIRENGWTTEGMNRIEIGPDD